MKRAVLNAIYQLAMDYHSGQSSRGYRLLCRCQRYAARRELTLRPNRQSTLYRVLVQTYLDKL
ncbi:MAG TPA: hypothetical protein VGL77_02705 [Armatimonadota bacterium]